MKSIDYKSKIDDIITNADKYHEKFYETEIFKGPRIYFHKKAIEAIGYPISDMQLEYIYAVLTAWGMQRQGNRGSQMVDFNKFKESIKNIEDKIKNAAIMKIEEPATIDYDLLKEIFYKTKIMESRTAIVGNSKVMSHLLPNMVPPVDRNYTMAYLKGNTNIINGIHLEWSMLKEILDKFFVPIASNEYFKIYLLERLKNNKEYPWDTSVPKIIDNLIVGARKMLK